MRRRLLVTAVVLAWGCGGGAAPASVEQARACLREAGFVVEGPLLREPDDADAPDETLMARSSGRRTAAYVGWYDAEARAERAAPEQVEHAKQFDGSVDRRGRMTIIWLFGKETDEGAALRRCVLK